MQLFDTHGHLNLEPLVSDWREHWQKAQEHQVAAIFIPGTSVTTSRQAIAQAKANDGLLAGVGVHPHRASEIVKSDNQLSAKQVLEQLKELLKENHQVVAGIGETGLDYYRLAKKQNKAKIINIQQQLFVGQIKLANQYKLPLSIHVRDNDTPAAPTKNNAYWDTLRLIKKHYQGNAAWILHCVSGPLEYLQTAIKQKAYISFAGNVTYNQAKQLDQLLEETPKDKLLVETDAPYLPPEEFRGKICEPWMIAKTVQFLKKKKGITAKELWQNATTVFNFNLL